MPAIRHKPQPVRRISNDPSRASQIIIREALQRHDDELGLLPEELLGITSGADLAAIEALTGTGLLARIAADVWALRTMVAPAAGLSIANPGGVAGAPTFALANDLAALEALASTGVAWRTGVDTWALVALGANGHMMTSSGTSPQFTPNIYAVASFGINLAGTTHSP